MPTPNPEVTPEKQCARCGALLAADAPEGLCPACLLKRGLETQTVAGENAPFTPPPPEELARYFPTLEIRELLGRGGMGVVYKARQRNLDRLVALKILAAPTERDPAFTERFAREAVALARLSHPNIVAVYDSGQIDGLCYFIMEYVDGLNLRQLLETSKMTPHEALAIVPQICDALQYAHEQGIVHRDIKPGNILLDKAGHVKIADFGIAKIAGREATDFSLTGAGETVGTPAYMAPEQIEHPQHVDHRADIYSLGVVFYQMLTGELPLGRFAPPSRKVQIDVRLDEVVLRALEKQPELRYQKASEVKTQVETIASTNPPDAKTAPPALLERVRWVVTGASFMVLITSFVFGVHLHPAILGIMLALWGLAGWCFVAWHTLRPRGDQRADRAALRVAHKILMVQAIGVLLGGMFLTLINSQGPREWNIFSAGLMACGVLVCLLRLVGALPRRRWSGVLYGPDPGSPSEHSAARPAGVWLAVIVLALLIVGKLMATPLVGFRAPLQAIVFGILLTGLLMRARWAYLLSIARFTFNLFNVAAHGVSMSGAPSVLTQSTLGRSIIIVAPAAIFSALVIVPVLLSARWFFPPEYADNYRRRWLWATAAAAVLAALAGLFNPLPPMTVDFQGLGLTAWPGGGVPLVGSSSIQPILTQDSTSDIQPDGIVRSTVTIEYINRTGTAINCEHFINSDFVHIEKIHNAKGQPIAFEARPGRNNIIEYNLTFNEPIPPGATVSFTSEGSETGLIKATGEPGVFEYSMKHWPAVNGITRRIELHRLPPGAELISKRPDDLNVEKVGDHIELHIDRQIPPGGHIEVDYRYRLAAVTRAPSPSQSPQQPSNAQSPEEGAGTKLPPTPQLLAEAKQTAKDFFEALERGDWNKISQLSPPGFSIADTLDKNQKEALSGLKLLSLGEPFTKAPYPGVFVPYEIRCKGGEVKKWNLAVRNDNPEQKWYWDGGF